MTSAEKLAATIVDPLSEQTSQALGQQRVNLINNVLLLRQAIEGVIRVARAEQRTELAKESAEAYTELVAILNKIRKAKKRKTISLSGLREYVEGRIKTLQKAAAERVQSQQGESPHADTVGEHPQTPASPGTSTSPEKP